VPAHLKEAEFLAACTATVAPGGVVVANLFNGGGAHSSTFSST
jgi:hypothetical protein